MKKTIALTLCFIIAASVFAFADGEPFANAGELYESWYQTNGSEMPYPEYVTGVWSTDGSMEKLTFAVMKGYEDQAKADILDQVADKGSVTLAEGGKYTLAELKAVQNQIGSLMSEGQGKYPVWGCGIDETDNVVLCSINMAAENAGAVKSELIAEYGDMICFEEGANAVTETAAVSVGSSAAMEDAAMEKESVSNIIAYALIGIGAAAIIASVIILKKKKDALRNRK